jgi:DNA (cytosine-5)-methyltransferase 1
VFVVGYLGDWRVAAAVLFERESLSGDLKPSRKKGKEITSDVEGGVGEAGSWWDGSQVAGTLTKQNANGAQRMPDKDNFGAILQQPFRKVRRAQSDSDFETWEKDETANTLNCFDVGDVRSTNVVAQPIAVDWRTAQVDQGIAQTLKTDLAKMSGPCVAVDTYNYTTNDHTTQTIRSQSDTEHIAVDVYNQSIDGQTSATITEAVGGTNTSGPKVMHSMAIRRLTVKECERLQGFPDDWTKIPYRNKPADQCPDGPRYKACGNSMAVPVMRWIGERIQLIDTIVNG